MDHQPLPALLPVASELSFTTTETSLLTAPTDSSSELTRSTIYGPGALTGKALVAFGMRLCVELKFFDCSYGYRPLAPASLTRMMSLCKGSSRCTMISSSYRGKHIFP